MTNKNPKNKRLFEEISNGNGDPRSSEVDFLDPSSSIELNFADVEIVCNNGTLYYNASKLVKTSKEERIFGNFILPFFTDLVVQYRMDKYFHNYDFYIPEFNLLVEYDGVYWHSMKKNQKKDKKHEIEAKRKGYNITRITDVAWKAFLKVNKIDKDLLLKLFNHYAR